MTANRADKGGGSMAGGGSGGGKVTPLEGDSQVGGELPGGGPMTAEQRAALEAAGWRLVPLKGGTVLQYLVGGGQDTRFYFWPGNATPDISGPAGPHVAQALAILGIAPPGYVMVPLDVARKGVYACEWASVNACARASTTTSAADQKVYDDYRKHLHALVAFLKG